MDNQDLVVQLLTEIRDNARESVRLQKVLARRLLAGTLLLALAIGGAVAFITWLVK
jgi:hypothetical protein